MERLRDVTGDISSPSSDEALLEEAVALPPGRRSAFLAEACRGDPARLSRLELLARSHEEAGRFLTLPAVQRPPIVPREQAGDVIGQYQLVERIGDGSSGVVWVADQRAPLRRKVALKIIKSGLGTRALVARFDTERQALAIMDHPNIARVYDAGLTPTGRPFFVMELVAGIPVTRYCDEAKLGIRCRLEVFLRVCDAVQHAHQKGILHRDLKPSNILVTELDGQPAPKVIDFGIAKALQGSEAVDAGHASTELLLGTPAYMSPEAAGGRETDVDTRSDIYTLGVLLYEVLTGCLPLDPRALLQGTLAQLRERLQSIAPLAPSHKVAALPAEAQRQRADARRSTPADLVRQLRGDLDAIVMRCLEKDRSRRYESVGALSTDLRKHLRHEPVSARPASPWYVAAKAIRRHRVGFGAGVAVLSAIVAGGTVGIWQAVRATQAERAESRLRKAETALRLEAEAQELSARRRAYAADMTLLQQALAQDNLGQATKLLNRHQPRRGEPDLRGWEWRYLWQLCQSEATAQLARLPSPVSSVAISPDGTWVAMGQEDSGTVVVRHLSTNTTTRLALGDGATRVAFSPREPLLAVLYSTGREPRRARLRLWQAVEQRVVAEWEVAGSPAHLLFDETGDCVVSVTGGRSGQVDRWDVPTGRNLGHISPAGGPVAALGPQRLLARELMRDGRAFVQVLETETWRERWSAPASEENISALAFSIDGRYLASAAGNAETVIRIWDVRTGAGVRTLHGHRTYVSALAFTRDDRALVSVSKDQTVRIWDPESGELQRTLRGHQLEIHSLGLARDGRALVTGGKDGVVLLWRTDTPLRQSYIRLNDPVAGWAFTPNGESVLTVDASGRVALRTGPEFAEARIVLEAGPLAPWAQQTGGGGSAAGVFFSRQAPLVAVADDSGNIKVFNWEERRLLTTLPTQSERILFAGWAKEGRSLIIGHALSGQGTDLQEWDLATAGMVRSWKTQDPTPQQFVLSADGRFSVVRSGSGVVSIFDLTDASQRPISGGAPMVNSIALSPDASLIAATSGVGWARVWRREDAQLAAELSGFVLGVHSATFTPGNDRLITGSGDQEALRLWDTRTWEPVLTLPSQGSRFGAVMVSSNERLIGSRSAFGRLHLWRAPSPAEIAAAQRP